MSEILGVLKNDERVVFALRKLYEKYGYSKYKMGKFEEYDLYVRNKDFLISDSVITFTDTNGRMKALKPDVTLSIIKNCKDESGCVEKLYYNENVYRVTKEAEGFREIMQAGLECIGDLDDYAVFEVLSLAMKSLLEISDDCVLDISHIGIITDIIDKMSLSNDERREVIKCIGEKNVHGISAICGDSKEADMLKILVSSYGSPEKVMEKLSKIAVGDEHLRELRSVCDAFKASGLADKVRIDFSVVDDIKYYNGIVFKGFVKGVPASILSGGRYDNLMKRMGKKSGAIGFAIYLDMLKNLERTGERFDADTLLLYEEGESATNISRAVEHISARDESVSAQRKIPPKFKYKRLVKLSNGEITEVLDNA
ncbi:MAG: ATP phosphoribosyltransferase regulatory subunit [Oscillospiraceae bacterium]|nr:ATP phosphoribosyltransferase regulatory subunit [Oscillospiraceae bacterium]